MNQQEIDKLLQSSMSNAPQKNLPKQGQSRFQQSQSQQNYEYTDQFQSYDESRQTNQFNQSKQFQQSNYQKLKNKTHQLTLIKQQKHSPENIDAKKHNKPNKKSNILKQTHHTPFNYARLQDRQKQLLFTTITQDNKNLKYELAEKNRQIKALTLKYNLTIEDKAKNSSTIREKLLEKENQNLKNKIQKLQNLVKTKQRSTPSITNLSKTQGKFIPEQQYTKRQQQLLGLIDKLKNRLVHSQEQLKTVQDKMNEGLDLNKLFHTKLKRVQQLQYKIDKMAEQASVDRQYIDQLKQKTKQLDKKVQQQKNINRRLQIQLKRSQLASKTNNDLVNQLKQVKAQKQSLQLALKNLSGTLMNNVRKKFKEDHVQYNKMQDSQTIFNIK